MFTLRLVCWLENIDEAVSIDVGLRLGVEAKEGTHL